MVARMVITGCRQWRTRIPMSCAFFLILLFVFSQTCPASSAPQRIVSLAPSCTEMVAGLGLTDRLVGVTTHCDYPPEVRRLPRVGSYVALNLEAIVSLQPDLIVATNDGNPKRVIQRLRQFHLRVVVLDLMNYQSIGRSLVELGQLVGKSAEAQRQVSWMRKVGDCIAGRTRAATRPGVLFVYESYPVITAGKDTFTDELIQMSGGVSVTHTVKIAYPTLTMEEIIARNPEVILQSSMDPEADKQKLKWWNRWPVLKAVKNNRIYLINTRNLDRPSQRVVFGLFQLAKILHPDLFPNNECLEGQ
jgi:cobalamin transport system substrate-binding protein